MTEEKKTTPSKAERLESKLKQRITRRQAVKVGGIAAAGLIFAKPIINTLRPQPAWAQVSPGPGPVGPGPVTPSTLSTVAHEGIRDFNGGVSVKTFGALGVTEQRQQSPTLYNTDKSIIEFNIGALSGVVSNAVLALTDHGVNLDLPFPIAVIGYTATADGVVTVADFTGGIIAATVPSYNGGGLSVDVTSFLAPIILPGGTTHVGFRLEHGASPPPAPPDIFVFASFVQTASTLTIS